MSQQLSSTNRRSAGFTLIEVLVSMAVLTIGLIGMAAMVCSTMVFGTNAKYMNMANVLASEKLDNLNKWPSTDPNVAAGGSLAGPSTCAAGDTYCDQVTVSETSGADYITQTQIVFDPVTNTSNPVTTTIVHTSAGCVDTPANCGVPSPRRFDVYSPLADHREPGHYRCCRQSRNRHRSAKNYGRCLSGKQRL